MGFIRGVLIVLAATIFFFASLSSAIFYTIGSSLDYSEVENKTIDLVASISSEINLEQMIAEKVNSAGRYCESNVSSYSFAYGNYTFRFSCDSLNQSVSNILDNTIRNFISDLYYEEYNCKFWDCFEKYPPTFLISAKSQSYWFKLFYFSMTALLLSAAALFFLIQKKRHLPFITGALIVLSSIIVLGLNKLLTALSNELIAEIVDVFFSKATFVFFRMIILAAIIIFAGFVIEFYRVGFKVYNLFSRLEQKKEAGSKDKIQKNADSKKK